MNHLIVKIHLLLKSRCEQYISCVFINLGMQAVSELVSELDDSKNIINQHFN